MSVPSMVHRSGDTLIVRSVVSGDALFGSADALEDTDYGDELAEIIDDKDLPDCKIKRNYSCASCDYFTQNPRHFLYHLRDVHKEKIRIYECPSCLYASKHFQKLLRHTKMVHGSTEGVEMPEYARLKGKKRPLAEDDYEEHADSGDADEGDDEPEGAVSDRATFKCSLCTFTARNQAQLGKHEREEHIKTKFFRCTKCTYVTHMKARFTKHVKYHSMPMIKCDLCDFRTPYKWNLDRHCKNHNGRGTFRCSACNFTADIKQSLTVHEMNHHVPPVGQAAGLGVGRRRNKVGASDSTAAEEAAQVARTEPELSTPADDDNKKASQKLKIPAKKSKTANNSEQSRVYGSDFIHPDDIIHHANGNIYIKNKCKLCNYKSAWDGEMAKHEEKVHNILRNNSKPIKKPPRPIPNLIPIPAQTSVLKVPQRPLQPVLKMSSSPPRPPEPVMSQKDISEICAKSANSSLKDFASLFVSEDVFKIPAGKQETDQPPKIPDLIPASTYSVPKPSTKSTTDILKQKNASFFDQLKAKLTSTNLTCQHCGHESKCLTESTAHQKICGKEQAHTPVFTPVHNISSTRCQYCRQRCKSSSDLINHLQKCPEALKSYNESLEETASKEKAEDSKEIEEEEEKPEEPHPMEHRVFVWNNIDVPMDVEADEQEQQYEYVEEKQEDNVSLDLSVRTQSPSSENSFLGPELQHNTSVSEKIPTHGTDISVAQHKRVFKCPHCTFWASTASRFHVHIVGHLNKKPFECSLCSYRSNWRWDITKHIKLKSVRDPAHETAKVLMTDETGRRNYTKYNRYLTEINISGDHNETSGGSGTRPKIHDSPSQVLPSKTELPKLTRIPNSNDFSPLLKNNLRPPPPLKAADGSYFTKMSNERKRPNADSKKTLWQCKKCNFRDASRDKLLNHVKGHYQQSGTDTNADQGESTGNLEIDEASVGGGLSRGQAPFRCGHCQQVSNWKHVIQRHCRLKHQGDIRVVIGTKNGPEKLEIDEQLDEPDHVDLPQMGTFKCKQCPFSNNNNEEFEHHLECHSQKGDSIAKCTLCDFYVSQREDLHQHLKLHGITNPEEYLAKQDKGVAETEITKRYKCLTCPYVTNSKSQYSYHKQFHKPRGGQYTCPTCGYNVSRRHLLHQHLKVHGPNTSTPKHNGEVIDLDEMSDEIEEVTQMNTSLDLQNLTDIPLVWVSKAGKFSKMYKCRFCPHVNLRKVNIQEHEKMHSVREKNPNTSRANEIEHHCPDCNYVCNNAGVLSSHSKVHQGLYGRIHCLVDPSKTDDEQIRELSHFINLQMPQSMDFLEDEDQADNSAMDCIEEHVEPTSDCLYFCDKCPARFFKEDEFFIHLRLHGVRLFYKCDCCCYSARQKPHLITHSNVHTQEYQDRTKTLKSMYSVHPDYPQPEIYLSANQDGELVWLAKENSSNSYIDTDPEPQTSIISNKPMKASVSVPLSGTDLFLQKNEANQKHLSDKISRGNDFFTSTSRTDPQFGAKMHGNPDFIYPTSLKNGRMKEKRYKCHKCPTAFEKREQYKVHLSLHGSKQKYKCDQCDYSVKYFANYSQHSKKHQRNNEAHAAKKPVDDNDDDEEVEDETEIASPGYIKNITINNGGLKLPMVAKQIDMIEQQRLALSKEAAAAEDKKLFWCPSCPYTNYRKDAVDNHQKRHISVSGSSNNYTCDHCDYSVPQVHFLRDHVKWHFAPNKLTHPDGYMICDKMKLTSSKAESENDVEVKLELEDEVNEDDVKKEMEEDEEPENLVFEDRGTGFDENRFQPPLSIEVLQRLNNNDGEKLFVNHENGELIKNMSNCTPQISSPDSNDVGMENNLDSQI